MNQYEIAHTDLKVSRIAYGCAELLPKDTEISPDVIRDASRLIHAARERGVNLFDLAAMYKYGRAESVFGEVLRRTPGLRQDIVIQSKCGAVLNPDARKPGASPFHFDCSFAGIIGSVEGSLRRLGVDYLDILLIHWPDILARPEEIASAFDELERSGKVRYFGVSNYNVGQIELLKRYVRQRLVVNQIPLGLASLFPLAADLLPLRDWNVRLPNGDGRTGDVVQYCRLHDIKLQAYSPLRGVTRGKFLEPGVLRDVANARKLSAAAVALAWLLRHPAEIVAVIGGKNPVHISENCLADEVELSRDEWYQLFFAAASLQSSD